MSETPIPTPDDAVAAHAEKKAREGDERYADHGGPVAAKLREELKSVTSELEGHRARMARIEAASSAGLPIAHADRLKGSTPDELAADARELAASLGRPASPHLTRPVPKTGVEPGAVAWAAKTDPRAMAAEIAKRAFR